MENKQAEIVTLAEKQPEKVDIADLVSKVGAFLISTTESQNATNLKLAEINKPITERQLGIQELGLKNQHDAWVKMADANIAKDKREFTTNSAILGGILLFLMVIALILVFNREYQLAFSAITLLIGFIGGYSLDKSKKKQENNQQ